MKSIGIFLPNRRSCLVLGLFARFDFSRIVWKIGGDLLSRRDMSKKLSISCKIFAILQSSNFNFFFKSKLVKFFLKLLVAPDELCTDDCTQRVISDKVHRLLVALLFSAG